MLLFIATSLFAASTTPTITFNVPVQLTKLHPNVAEVRVSCICVDQSGAQVTDFISSPSNAMVPDANGNINKTVTITVQAVAGKDIASAKTYLCTLGIRPNGAPGLTQPKIGSDAPIELQAKAGKPFDSQVTGNINW